MLTHPMQQQAPGLIFAAALLLTLPLPGTAGATPSFARQIDADCRTCHFQNMHGLNRFGRAFKANSFNLSEPMKRKLEKKRQLAGGGKKG
ncbi:MAG TPA: hypothetical protein VKA31_08120 [Mariprofundaceae bacterium]|nr:hypothetical protein [Mariprofundaceae bacterium]